MRRQTNIGQQEELKFSEGLNLLVGLPNAGKSTWIEMLDYALGKDGTPEHALGPSIAEKYGRVEVSLRAGSTPLELLRVWDGSGPKSKTQLNGEWLTGSEFSEALMMALDYPLLRFPQGNPYSDRSWPALTFRTMMRHLYRPETDWADLVPRQPEDDQHAVIALLLGVAEELFPEEYGQLIDARKRLGKLEAEHAAYERAISDVARQILDLPGLSVAITPESAEASKRSLTDELDKLQDSRLELLSTSTSGDPAYFAYQVKAKAALADQLAVTAGQRKHVERRLAELARYEQDADSEVSRLRRAEVAGRTLGRFPVAICPACNKSLEPLPDDQCSLCGSPRSYSEDTERSDAKIRFELDQLGEELREIRDLRASLETELEGLIKQQALLIAELAKITDRVSIAAVPVENPERAAELAGIDMRIGRTREKLDQLERVDSLLRVRDEYVSKAQAIQQEIDELGEQLSAARISTDLESRSHLLAEGMNDFLNLLNEERPGAWHAPEIAFRLKEREFSFKVGGREWKSVLGATLRLYFLFAYHFGLMSLSGKPDASFAGFSILDLPPSLADGPDITEYGDYAIRPFVSLLARSGHQIIVSGRAFPTIASAHRIELPSQWVV